MPTQEEWKNKIVPILLGILILLLMIFAYLNFTDAAFYCKQYCKSEYNTEIFRYEPGSCKCQDSKPPVDGLNFSSQLGNT